MITATQIAKIRAISDVWERASAAQAALRVLEPVEKTTRDAAALVLVAPYARAAQESNAFRAIAKSEYEGYWAKEDGEKVATTKASANRYSKAHPGVTVVYHAHTINQTEYLERLETARKMRDESFAAARAAGEKIMEPAKVCEALGMHRNLLVRLMNRRSAVPDLPNALEEGKKASDELVPLTATMTELREIRDAAIAVLIAEAIPSVDIANYLGITPARITQIRYGSHR